MEAIIEATMNGFTCKIGKQTNGTVNVSTNFKPLDHSVMILELDSSPEVEYISNIAYYGDGVGVGGLSVKLAPAANEMDLKNALEDLMKLHF